MTRPWDWRGPSTFAREGESTKPGEQVETALERRERATAKVKVQKPNTFDIGTSSAPTSSGGSPRGPGDGEPGLPPRVPAPRPQEAPRAADTIEGDRFTPRKPARDHRGRFTSHPEPIAEGRLTPRQPRAQLVKALASWLRADLSKGPVVAASIRVACRKRKINAKVLRESCQRAGVVSYIEADGSETWGVLVTGKCPHCTKLLRCMDCGRAAVYPHPDGILLPLREVAQLCLWRPSTLRSYLSKHKGMFPTRYRRHPGGRRERVLTIREAQMVQEFALSTKPWFRKERGK